MTKKVINCYLWVIVIIGVGFSLSWVRWPASAEATMPAFDSLFVENARYREALVPLPMVGTLSADKVALGNSLFFDQRLSPKNDLACATCHNPDQAWADGRRVATHHGVDVSLNTPSLLNARFNYLQGWEGRSGSLKDSVAQAIGDPGQMGSSMDEVLAKLSSDTAYRDAFARSYPGNSGGVSPDTVTDALANYLRSLVAVGPFDRYLAGDTNAIGESAILGYRYFKELGCVSCHQGVNVGGNVLQRLKISGYSAAGTRESQNVENGKPANSQQAVSLGRFDVSGRDQDRYRFRVPSLRNVALTAPYFHDGSVANLAEAVRVMGRQQLGRELSKGELEALLASLNALTGSMPAVAVVQP